MAGMRYKIVPSHDEVLVGLTAKSLLDLNKMLLEHPNLSAKELVAFLEECYDKVNHGTSNHDKSNHGTSNRENKPKRWWG